MFFNVLIIIERTTKNIPDAILQKMNPMKNTTQIGSREVLEDRKNNTNAQIENKAPILTKIQPSPDIIFITL